MMAPLEVKRISTRLEPDTRRTITRFFWRGTERGTQITARVLSLPEDKASALLQEVEREFIDRHLDLERRTGQAIAATPTQKLLLGAHYTMEFAFESAALFNPSMVPIPSDANATCKDPCFLLSLRAVGEGHISVQ